MSQTSRTGTPSGTSGPTSRSRAPEAPIPREPVDTVHEAYSFACLRCGHGWEQEYDVQRFVDQDGHEFFLHLADGHRVPSPLTRPTCFNCGGHVVRIMQAGRVAAAKAALRGTASGDTDSARGGMEAHVPSERSRPRDDGGGAASGGRRRSLWSRIFGAG
ncbi:MULTISPECIES: FmdB family zinc ribbon protein [Streptomyces]|uniref:C2H2-type domain-containing protein n=1 Tax=Streptomyces griseus TaxID=1911 RepID=A0A380MP42_STRGR|nr:MULTISPECIES: hypothetical protein [Streptomyces]MBL3804930.1 hypothetical protein [Streptomyces sp. BRB081]NEC13165.1 hypothetical protein [Streptomyces sp. SID8014]SUO94038.1 Uncharacterised protein [Streptomyces griseus]